MQCRNGSGRLFDFWPEAKVEFTRWEFFKYDILTDTNPSSKFTYL